jgi:hypothetical protein
MPFFLAGWLYALFGTLYEPAFILGLYIYTKLASKNAKDVNSGEIMSTYL